MYSTAPMHTPNSAIAAPTIIVIVENANAQITLIMMNPLQFIILHYDELQNLFRNKKANV